MKILFFNLGTIEHRILSWEVEGFRSLFEQDIILWGPVPDKQFIYKGKEIPILRVFEQTSVRSLFAQLPEGWYPDIVTCDTSVLNYVADIYKCPVKTLLFTRDSWSDTVFNRGLVDFFDFLSSSTIDRSLYSDYHVRLLPLSGFAVSTPGSDSINSEFEQRDIDVIAIANYDNSFYHERHKIFYKLSASNKDHFKINFVKSVERSGISGYYQRSKIVLDWAHTLSNRSYEAALNGCLLFSHEDNKVMNEFWVPWDEYIPYNENNLLELIEYYLNNNDQAKQIVGNAQRKIATVPLRWGEMEWDKVCLCHDAEISIVDRIKYNETLSPSTLHYRSATPLLYNYDYNQSFPGNWIEIYFGRINNAISSAADDNERILPLIEASRVAFILRNTDSALAYLDQLQKVLPDYAWIYYMRARIFVKQGDYNVALELIRQAILCGTNTPELLQRYLLPVIEKRNTCDGRRIISYMWQSVYNHQNEFQVKVLMHLAFELSGFIQQKLNMKRKAIDDYLEAVNFVPIPDCIYRLSPLLIESGEYDQLLAITRSGLEDSPYDSIIVLYHSLALLRKKQKRLAIQVLKGHHNALKSFVGTRQNFRIRVSINLILILTTLGKGPGSMAIKELVKRLITISGCSYLE